MKKTTLVSAGLFVTALISASAQSSLPVAATSTTPVSSSVTPRPLPADDRAISLAWTETSRNLQIEVSNADSAALKILGAQSTPAVYIVDFPKTIPARGSAAVSIIYEAKAGAEGEVELIRLKTDRGEKLIRISVAREPVVTFETKQLRWNVGEAVQPKTVLLAVDSAVSVKSVNAAKGHTAVFQRINATNYRIVVTPQSTAKPTSFPVTLTLNPSVPGITPVITCLVENPN